MIRRLVLLMLSVLPLCAAAAPKPGIHFTHHDWEVACDNTRTCRAAGYNADDSELAISVLLTRKAGPNQPVTGELAIGHYGDDEAALRPLRLTLRINGRSAGQVTVGRERDPVALSAQQVAALVAALRGSSAIELVDAQEKWILSGRGASAVLLKMDDAQGRVGTRGALLKPGPRDEAAVLPALPLPVIVAAPVPQQQISGNAPPPARVATLRTTLLASMDKDECDAMQEAGDKLDLSFDRLSQTQLIVSAPCANGAYNASRSFWIVDTALAQAPKWISSEASDYADGVLSAQYKGRGLGDCWSSEQWVWDGKEFVHSAASTTGQCKLITPGGAWSLPTLVTEVRTAKSK